MPLIVAINKMDKSDADPGSVKNELADRTKSCAEEFGGDTQFVELSAKTGDGVDDLLDAILAAGRSAGAQGRAPMAAPAAWSSNPRSTRAAARSRRCWCSRAR